MSYGKNVRRTSDGAGKWRIIVLRNSQPRTAVLPANRYQRDAGRNVAPASGGLRLSAFLNYAGSAHGAKMKITSAVVKTAFLLGMVILMTTSMPAAPPASSVYDFTLPSIDGKPMPLSEFKGKVLLLVNVASRCGFTPQYSALESVYEKYKGQGLVILGFPANNFGAQEPGTNQEIKTFCSTKYNVTFPMYSKVSVKGDDQTPLYSYLTKQTAKPIAGDIKWNFTKFLVDRNGKVVQRFEPDVVPDSAPVVSAVETLLKP
jgi:glutathione peroxidase